MKFYNLPTYNYLFNIILKNKEKKRMKGMKHKR